MDVDIPSPSGFKRSPSSSSTINKRPKLDWEPGQIAVLNERMMEESSKEDWEAQVEEAGDSDLKWRRLFMAILQILTDLLQATDLQYSVIPPLQFRQVREMVNSFGAEVFQEWKLGVMGVCKATGKT